jgi:thiol-disulfide isomerase/thioredoxin
MRSLAILIVTFFLCISAYASNNITAYLFWGDGCVHCQKEKDFLAEIQKKYTNLTVRHIEIYKNPNNAALFRQVADKFGITNIGVPLLIIEDQSFIGYSSGITPNDIEKKLQECMKHPCPDQLNNIANIDSIGNANPLREITIPMLGKINLAKSAILPIVTIAMGVVDGFNPCAMWVLLFLIGLLLNMKDKRRRWILGSSFIFISGLVYYIFMVAWLKFIMFLNFIIWVRIGIGITAIAVGAYSLKEFFLTKHISCNISGPINKGSTFQKLKRIIHEQNFLLALLGIVALAFTVNLVELACSAGLPATFIQVLLLNNLPSWQYYSYIFLYIFFFMLDDLFVFFIAMLALEITGLTNKYVKLSKLIGGIIMLAVGLLLIFKPQWLTFL